MNLHTLKSKENARYFVLSLSFFFLFMSFFLMLGSFTFDYPTWKKGFCAIENQVDEHIDFYRLVKLKNGEERYVSVEPMFFLNNLYKTNLRIMGNENDAVIKNLSKRNYCEGNYKLLTFSDLEIRDKISVTLRTIFNALLFIIPLLLTYFIVGNSKLKVVEDLLLISTLFISDNPIIVIPVILLIMYYLWNRSTKIVYYLIRFFIIPLGLVLISISIIMLSVYIYIFYYRPIGANSFFPLNELFPFIVLASSCCGYCVYYRKNEYIIRSAVLFTVLVFYTNILISYFVVDKPNGFQMFF